MSTASAPPASRGPGTGSRFRLLGLDWFELTALVLLAGVSMSVLIPLLTQGRPLSGVDGIFPPDQTQYFAWIREAAHHGLIGNRFDLAPGARPFLHPGFGLSGLLHDVTGISIPLSYLAWKPVAVGVTFAGCLLYVRRLIPSLWERRVALVLALFSVMPAVAIVAWTNWGDNPRQYTFDFISGEMWTGQYLWGYLMTAMAVFLIPLTLLGVESWRRSGRTRTLVLATLGALVVFWLQPWQGAVLVFVVFAAEAVLWRRTRERPPLALLAIPVAAGIPAVYYFILSHADASWKLASESNAAGVQPLWSWPWWAIVLTMGPLILPAALAYRLPSPTWQDVAVRAWPIGALIVYLMPIGTFPYHAIQGVQLPLSILAVQGVASLAWRPRPVLVVGALLLLTVPSFIHKVGLARTNIHEDLYPYYVLKDEGRALNVLEHDPRPGGVLAAEYASNVIPYQTGREAYVGALSWSPNFDRRRDLANKLFNGKMSPTVAQDFVISTHARFLFSGCRLAADLTRTLRPILADVRHYGCATIYELKERPGMSEAAGPPDS